MDPFCFHNSDNNKERPPGQRSPGTEISLTETRGQRPPLDRDPPWTETPLGQRPPLDRDPPWTETPLGQRPPLDRDPLDRDPLNRGPPVDRQTPVKTLRLQTSFAGGKNTSHNGGSNGQRLKMLHVNRP